MECLVVFGFHRFLEVSLILHGCLCTSRNIETFERRRSDSSILFEASRASQVCTSCWLNQVAAIAILQWRTLRRRPLVVLPWSRACGGDDKKQQNYMARGFAPCGCDATNTLSEEECALLGQQAFSHLPQTYQYKLKVAKPFQVNYQLVFPFQHPTTEPQARSLAMFFEEQLKNKEIFCSGAAVSLSWRSFRPSAAARP